MILDAHQHFWHFDPVRDSWIDESMKAIRRDFLPRDLEPLLAQHGVDGTVAVQAAESHDETRFLLELAHRHPSVRAVVGWIDVEDPALESRLEEWSREPKLAGFRHILQAREPQALLGDSLTGAIGRLARYGFTYDLLLYPKHLKNAAKLVQRFPDQPFVLDHMGKPPIRSGNLESWYSDLAELARFPNLCCKLSGLVTEADPERWTPGQINAVIDIGLELFEPDRLMFGSDWPVCRLAADYSTVLGLIRQKISKLSDDEQSKILGGSAARFYGIESPPD